MSNPVGAQRYGLGGGDAYYDAVKYGGYTGTREQFGRDQAEFAQNATAVAKAREEVEQNTQTVVNTAQTFTEETVPAAIQSVEEKGDTEEDRLEARTTELVEAVNTAGAVQVQAVRDEGTTQTGLVSDAGTAQVEAVEQAGSDQVQAVNGAGTTQVGNVNQAGADQITAVEQAGAGQVQAVTDEGTTQVGAVTGEGDTQVQRVQDKGDEVLNSIPADYTALDQKVDHIGYDTEYTGISLDIENAYNGDVCNVSSDVNNTVYRTGKNLFWQNGTGRTNNGITFVIDPITKIITVSGTATGSAWMLQNSDSVLYYLPAGIYTLIGGSSKFKVQATWYENGTAKTSSWVDGTSPVSFTLKEASLFKINGNVANGTVFSSAETFEVMLVKGTVAEEWEQPYRISKEITANSSENIELVEGINHLFSTADAKYNYKTPVTKLAEEVDTISTEIDEINIKLNGEKIPFEFGNISIGSSGWSYSNSTTRIRTPQEVTMPFVEGQKIKLADDIEVYWGVQVSATGNYNHSGSWKRGIIELPYTGNYVFVIRTIPEATISDVDSIADKVEVVDYDAFSVIMDNITGTGNTDYYGEKIVLTNKPAVLNRCNISVYKDFKGSEIQDITDYRFDKNQSIAIYDNYVFLLNEGGLITVLDYGTKEIISTFSNPVISYQHQNSAQFTDIFYDSNDDFPLLLISRCGNSGWESGEHDYDEAEILRITKNGTAFSCELINTIKLNLQTYAISWGVDTGNHKLYACGYVNGNYAVTTNNPIHFWIFEMPSATSILSGTPISINESDNLAHMILPFAIFQGLTITGSLVYVAVQILENSIKKARLWCVDIYRNRILTVINIDSSREPEGVAIYNEKLYISQKNGADTTGVNPMKIYEFDFNTSI